MKILLILASTGPMVGGMERQVALQAKYLCEIPNVEITVISPLCFQGLFPERVQFIPLKMNRSRRNIVLLFRFQQAITLIKPDIIHAHGHKAASILTTIKPLLNKSIKLVATAHNVKRNNRALKKMDEVFVVSAGIQQAVAPIHSVVIHNGIEPCNLPQSQRDSFCKNLKLDPRKPLILGVGRLVKTKRFECLINAAKNLDANIVILGDGPERSTLQALASSNVRLAGYRSDTRSLLFIADIMVICADRDGFSLALIEALHSHLPVLSTRVPGAQDLLPESSLIDATNETDLSAFIQNHLNNLAELKHSQKKQFAFVEAELSMGQVAQRTYIQYKQLLRT